LHFVTEKRKSHAIGIAGCFYWLIGRPAEKYRRTSAERCGKIPHSDHRVFFEVNLDAPDRPSSIAFDLMQNIGARESSVF
jgi:hypothetical protein